MDYGNMTVQDQAIILPVSAMGFFSRDTSLASGNQAVTGVGFKPSSIIFLSAQSAAVGEMSIGAGNGSQGIGLSDRYNTTPNTYSTASPPIVLNQAAAVDYTGTILSLDTDGFTIAWVKSGATIGVCNIRYMAFK